MTAYLTIDEFKNHTTMPPEFIDGTDGVDLDFLTVQLERWSRWIDSRLRKRYSVPFALPAPMAVQGWLEALVTVRCYNRRGVNPTDEQYQDAVKAADTARAEITEAANSAEGLFDLPEDDTADKSAIAKGGPSTYSEQSPYVAFDAQIDTGRNEDFGRGGSFYG